MSEIFKKARDITQQTAEKWTYFTCIFSIVTSCEIKYSEYFPADSQFCSNFAAIFCKRTLE